MQNLNQSNLSKWRRWKRRVLPALIACAIVVALGLGWTSTTEGQIISSPSLIYVPPSVVSTKARELIGKMPDFAGTQILRYTPIYAPRSSQVVFYEAKVINPNLQNRGFIILKGDGTVVQFATQGPSKHDQLRAKTSLSFKMVRLGPKYFAAEYRGLPVAELGTFPELRVNNATNQLMVTTRSSNIGDGTTGVSLTCHSTLL